MLCENDLVLLLSSHHRHEDSIYGFLKVVAANVVHDHFKSALAAKRGAGQTDAILEQIQMEPKMANADSFDMVSQRLQLEQLDKILTQLTAGEDQEKKSTIFLVRPPQGLTAPASASIPSMGLTPPRGGRGLMLLAGMIWGALLSLSPHP